MPPRVYKLTVLAGALSWMMFGMYLNSVLEAGASEPQSWLQRTLLGLFFLMGAADVWWLLRFGTARALPPSGPTTPTS